MQADERLFAMHERRGLREQTSAHVKFREWFVAKGYINPAGEELGYEVKKLATGNYVDLEKCSY